MRAGIGNGPVKLRPAAINGIGRATRRVAKEIHRNGARPAANVPEHRPRKGCQLGKGACPRIPLRQLAVIVKTGIRGRQPVRHRPGIGTFDPDNMKIGHPVMRPVMRRAIDP